MSKEYRFNPGDFVVYPTHGVGKVVDITQSEVAGQKLELIAVNFDKDRMTMRIPMTNVGKTHLRPLSSLDIMETALESLKGKPKIKKTMWSRRSQEYDAKINSGDPCQIAEVVRDLNKPADKGEQSYSERQVFEHAFGRLVHEYAACAGIGIEEATAKIQNILKGEQAPTSTSSESSSL
ncbi:MAG: CarD family transcriptional regulator [Alphaproteobacteria bacterium]|nr:CarD family transcriptional regulator [Alphaproteobacteria bacterium]